MNKISRVGCFYLADKTYCLTLDEAQARLATIKLRPFINLDYASEWRDMLRALREVEAYDGLSCE